jgi:hypothetical protein
MKRTVIELSDDLDGGKAEETVKFGLDGKSFEVDLNRRNAAKLRKALEPYMSAGRRVARARRASPATASDTAAVRRWAESNGIEVSKRGRIPRDVVAQYEAAGH